MKNSDVYEKITNRVIESLNKGVVPWRKSWDDSCVLQESMSTGKAYKGINQMLLSLSAELNGYKSNKWLTCNQANKLGGYPEKGSKATEVCYWTQMYLDKDGKYVSEKAYRKMSAEDKSNIKVLPMVKLFWVFNTDQIVGDDFVRPEPIKVKPINENEKNDVCESVYAKMIKRPLLSHGSSQAYYRPSTHAIKMPDMNKFDTSSDYYHTLYHELIHSTGHKDILDRDGVSGVVKFGSHEYSKEELIAEMGAQYLSSMTGVSSAKTESNSDAYIGNWIKVLENDHKFLITAASRAQKAVDYIISDNNNF